MQRYLTVTVLGAAAVTINAQPPPPKGVEACRMDSNGCTWLAGPCSRLDGSIPPAVFVPLYPNQITIPGLGDNPDISGVHVAGGFVAGGSVGNDLNKTREPILCAFPYNADTVSRSSNVTNISLSSSGISRRTRGQDKGQWIVAIEDGKTNYVDTKMVKIQLSVLTGVITAVGASAIESRFTSDLGMCGSESSLNGAWSQGRTITTATCEQQGPTAPKECNGYGVAGLELSTVSSTNPKPWSTFDLSKPALPAGYEYTAVGLSQDQTFFYNFCKGTNMHGSPADSKGFRCDKGTTAVCQVTDSTVGRDLAYPAGVLASAKLTANEFGVRVSYANPPSYDNGRNTVVSISCDKYATEPVFFAVREEPGGGPRYDIGVKSAAGCAVKPDV